MTQISTQTATAREGTGAANPGHFAAVTRADNDMVPLSGRESAELLARHILGRNADPVALDAYADFMSRVVALTRAEVVDGGGDPDELGRAFLDAAQRVGAQIT